MEDYEDSYNGSGRRTVASVLIQGCCEVERNNVNSGILRSYYPNGHQHHHHHHQHQHTSGSTDRNIEIDWREVDPYYSELSDCASFWTLINFTCDVIYSGLFVLFFIMGQDVESMFFEGLLNHINPILVYLILSLTTNYGALRSLRCGREKCFLCFSILKGLLFPISLSILVYLVFFDVQEYFGTFWVSFVVIVSCYNGTAALCIWSMFICNKYILVNEAAQKRMRKHAKQQRSEISETDCRCSSNRQVASSSLSNYCERNHHNHNQNQRQTQAQQQQLTPTPGSRPVTMTHSRKIGDSSSSCAKNKVVASGGSCSSKVYTSGYTDRDFNSVYQTNSSQIQHSKVFHSECGPSRIAILKGKKLSGQGQLYDDDTEDDGFLSVEDEDEVLQISTVHKVMQEINLLDSKKNKRDHNYDLNDHDHDASDDCDSL